MTNSSQKAKLQKASSNYLCQEVLQSVMFVCLLVGSFTCSLVCIWTPAALAGGRVGGGRHCVAEGAVYTVPGVLWTAMKDVRENVWGQYAVGTAGNWRRFVAYERVPSCPQMTDLGYGKWTPELTKSDWRIDPHPATLKEVRETIKYAQG